MCLFACLHTGVYIVVSFVALFASVFALPLAWLILQSVVALVHFQDGRLALFGFGFVLYEFAV